MAFQLFFCIHTTITLATLDGEIVDPEIAVKLERGVHLKYMVHKPNIYIVWYIKCDDIFMTLEWGNIYRNVFSCIVFREDTLVEIKGNFR